MAEDRGQRTDDARRKTHDIGHTTLDRTEDTPNSGQMAEESGQWTYRHIPDKADELMFRHRETDAVAAGYSAHRSLVIGQSR